MLDNQAILPQCMKKNKCQYDFTLMPITLTNSTMEALEKNRKQDFLYGFFFLILSMKATHEHTEV